MGEVVIHNLIPEGMYRELMQSTNLHGLMRSLFSPIENVEQYDELLVQAERVRQTLIEFQEPAKRSLSKSVLRNLPIMLILDRSSRQGARYLRWRNINNMKSGKNVWKEIIGDPQQPQVLRQSLVKAEKELIVLNMQMTILTHIIRQLSECREKLHRVDQLALSSLVADT